QPHGDLDIDCTECHTLEAWTPLRSPLSFDHDDTGFGLFGAHDAATCSDCHETLVFSHVPTACADCHDDAHRGELGFACESCHDAHSWENRRALFDAHNQSLFPLLGTHATLDCESCHGGQQPFEFATTPTECAGCHFEDYQASTDPDHADAGFSLDCEECHAPLAATWQQALFIHPSSFLLRGAHRRIGCSSCHEGSFAGTPSDCFSCHRQDYDQTTDPDHQRSGFPTDCEDCHNENTWQDARFDHSITAFVLSGAHRPLDCNACHSQGFTGTPTDCVACHRQDYNQTTEPDHRAAGFSTSCEICHGQGSWEGAEFDHDSTVFRLSGAHRPLDCDDCHAAGFAGTPTDCVACHRQDYNQTTDPNHQAAGFPTACERCHGTATWEGATVDHDTTRFPLTGSHRGIDCEACHRGGSFAGTPTDCVACHRSEYDQTSNPNHQAAGFPLTCDSCHGTQRWQGAVFAHFFPIDSGAHSQLDCSECHFNPNNYAAFTCTNCHEHQQGEMNDKHDEVGGYVYESSACLACHPDGREHDDD
ncbi:MAG: cytochrome c3 family protein, partial [Thermoanaerobaculia bacterium]|nr:cytochrome c3 family protein [Thermoanaerobaculia bacterium]